MYKTHRYTLLLFSEKNTGFDSISQWLGSHYDGHIELLGYEPLPLEHSESYSSCLKVKVQIGGRVDLVHLRTIIDGVAQFFECDYCLLASDFSLAPIKLAVFDMDSTLIPMEVIDELAVEAGVKQQVAAITELAMQGGLDFNQSFEQRLALLKDMPINAVEAVKSKLCFNPGVENFLTYLKANQADVAIASGGFIPFAESLSDIVHSDIVHPDIAYPDIAYFDEIRANHLEFEDGKLTGRAVTPIINAEQKAQSLETWRASRQLSVKQTMAIGDGANDLLMIQRAGLGVAYKAKPFLRQYADCVIQYAEMDALKDVLQVVYRL